MVGLSDPKIRFSLKMGSRDDYEYKIYILNYYIPSSENEAPPTKESMKIYLRVRPLSTKEKTDKEDEGE